MNGVWSNTQALMKGEIPRVRKRGVERAKLRHAAIIAICAGVLQMVIVHHTITHFIGSANWHHGPQSNFLDS